MSKVVPIQSNAQFGSGRSNKQPRVPSKTHAKTVSAVTRKNFAFKNKSVDITLYDGEVVSFPCIGLYNLSD